MRYASGIKIHGTKSFRLSCSKLLSYYGGNIQNPPDDLLRCMVPKPGNIFIQVDQAGAESNVVAHEAERGLYREIILAGIKPHVYTALHLPMFIDEFRDTFPVERYWKQPPSVLQSYLEWKGLVKRIKSNAIGYYLGKVTNHARSYRMKWPTFQLTVLNETAGKVALTNKQAKECLETWDELFPEVVFWQDTTEHVVRTTRTLRNLFNYPRQFYGRMTDALIREAISWVPQSTVAVITHKAVCRLQDYIELNNKHYWEQLFNKHDSYLAEVPISDTEEACKVMKDFMCCELTSTTGNKFSMNADVSIGYNALKYNEATNPDGLKEL